MGHAKSVQVIARRKPCLTCTDHNRVEHGTGFWRPHGYQHNLVWASVRECHPTLNYAFDDGAESVLRGECPFDSRDDVQQRDYSGDLEDPFGDRHTPQHDIELATEFNGVFLRL